MSNALAIGAVTAVIKSLLENSLNQADVVRNLGAPAVVTVLSPTPDDATGGTQNRDRLNLFLYQTTPNPSWRNAGLPSRDGQGVRVSNAPLALDLHYLLTAYSKQSFHAEILLGYAMQTLHETSILAREAIRNALRSLAANSEPAFKALATADLADQVEQIKITPQTMTTEEMSKLWSAVQSPYRPTAAYQVSVVLIESQRPVKSTKPVLQRNLYIAPLVQPVIERLRSLEGDNQPIVMGSTVVIDGQHLKADSTTVNMGGVALPIATSAITDRQIQVPLATPALPDSLFNALRAGIQPVQVVHDLILGSPGDPHRGVESNVMAFVLRPTIRRDPALGDRYQITVSGVQTEPNRDPFRVVTVGLTPAVGPEQRVRVLLSHRDNRQTLTAVAEPRQVVTDTITARIPADLAAGTYLVQVQVDGAESPLVVDAENRFVAPSLTFFP